ncbi:MAG: alpha/beta fold hydrolase [Verrucomicrobiota bacterium]
MSNSPSPETRTIGGIPLSWYRWLPSGTPRGALFFFHGQGDFAERYQDIAEILLSQNLAFLTCDLPGHGNSPGIRGHIPSLELIEAISLEGITQARKASPNGLLGLGGHSMGGLLALHSLQTTRQTIDFSWISSPLLVPEAGQPEWKTKVLKPLAKIIPTLPVSTGVRAELCREYLPGESKTNHLLFHNLVSLGWGSKLITLGQQVRSHTSQLPNDLQLFLTQGGQDRICPPEHCHQFVETLSLPNLLFKFYQDARHEPFADTSRKDLFEVMRNWLAEI